MKSHEIQVGKVYMCLLRKDVYSLRMCVENPGHGAKVALAAPIGLVTSWSPRNVIRKATAEETREFNQLNADSCSPNCD